MKSLYYGLFVNLPIIVFGVPFYFFCDFMQNYLATNYPNLYHGSKKNVINQIIPSTYNQIINFDISKLIDIFKH